MLFFMMFFMMFYMFKESKNFVNTSDKHYPIPQGIISFLKTTRKYFMLFSFCLVSFVLFRVVSFCFIFVFSSFFF